MDVTHYLNTYHMTAKELASRMILDVMQETGITATAGIGTNLYLCKVAMDIVAKHVAPDANGVRIAELDEMTYRKLLWSHQTADRFLAGRTWLPEKVRGGRTLHDGRHCTMFHR